MVGMERDGVTLDDFSELERFHIVILIQLFVQNPAPNYNFFALDNNHMYTFDLSNLGVRSRIFTYINILIRRLNSIIYPERNSRATITNNDWRIYVSDQGYYSTDLPDDFDEDDLNESLRENLFKYIYTNFIGEGIDARSKDMVLERLDNEHPLRILNIYQLFSLYAFKETGSRYVPLLYPPNQPNQPNIPQNYERTWIWGKGSRIIKYEIERRIGYLNTKTPDSLAVSFQNIQDSIHENIRTDLSRVNISEFDFRSLDIQYFTKAPLLMKCQKTLMQYFTFIESMNTVEYDQDRKNYLKGAVRASLLMTPECRTHCEIMAGNFLNIAFTEFSNALREVDTALEREERDREARKQLILDILFSSLIGILAIGFAHLTVRNLNARIIGPQAINAELREFDNLLLRRTQLEVIPNPTSAQLIELDEVTRQMENIESLDLQGSINRYIQSGGGINFETFDPYIREIFKGTMTPIKNYIQSLHGQSEMNVFLQRLRIELSNRTRESFIELPRITDLELYSIIKAWATPLSQEQYYITQIQETVNQYNEQILPIGRAREDRTGRWAFHYRITLVWVHFPPPNPRHSTSHPPRQQHMPSTDGEKILVQVEKKVHFVSVAGPPSTAEIIESYRNRVIPQSGYIEQTTHWEEERSNPNDQYLFKTYITNTCRSYAHSRMDLRRIDTIRSANLILDDWHFPTRSSLPNIPPDAVRWPGVD